MNIFNSLKTYAGKWNPVAEEAFDQASIDAVSKAEVVESQYGYSVAFYLKAGGTKYLPLDKNSSLSPGDPVDLTKATIITLHREGDEDIYKLKI